MSVIITPTDVKSGFPTTVSDDEITLLISIVDGADLCLDGAAVPDNTQRILKIYAVRHMLQLQSNNGKGVVKSERAPSGASRSYGEWSGVGISASPFGSLLKQLDVSGCIVGLLENGDNNIALLSVGGGC